MNLRIRTRIVLIAVAILLLAIGINASIDSYILTREYSNALQSRALVIGQSLALQLDRLLKYGIFLDEVVGFEKQCQETVSEYKETSYAMVVDTEGKILFHNDPSQRGRQLSDAAQLKAAAGTEPQVIEVYPQPGEGYYDATIPIFDSRSRHVAAVKVGLPTKLVTQRIQTLLVYSGATALGSLGLAAILLILTLSIWVTKPLAQLLTAVQEIGQKGTAGVKRVEIRSRDEVGQLAFAFNGMAEQIGELVSGLEQRVAERTAELQRRAVQLATAAEVARAASSILDPGQLLNQTVELIAARFNLYHVGLFLVDRTGQWAVLQAASSEGGQHMLARQHRLQVGQEGIVGYVAVRGEPRIALDVGADPVFFDNPDLPDTHSEMALPLQARGEIMGALDVQSVESGAFGDEDVAIFQTLANQVAMAISNARLFQQAQESLEAERRAYGELSSQAWRELAQTRPDLGFVSDKQGVVATGGLWEPQMVQAAHTGEATPGDGDGSVLAIPIKVRGNVIGVVDAHKPGHAGRWTAEEAALMGALVEQLGTALESARLYQDTQRRAARESFLREISDQLQRTPDTQTLVRIAAEELTRVLHSSRTRVRLSIEDSLSQPAGNGQASEGGQ
jgi:GAF domain-containing protein/HAMP domain-containing protein